MRMNYIEVEEEPVKRDKTRTSRLIVKIFAIVLIILSIVFLIFGLIPQDRVEKTDTTLSGGVGSYKMILVNEGDILVVDFVVDGNDVSFYITYGGAWIDGNRDYIVKKEHVRSGHLQINIENSGEYFLNFENNDPSSSSFNVDLSYKIMDRFSPFYIILGIASLIGGLILYLKYHLMKKKPSEIDSDYIRL